MKDVMKKVLLSKKARDLVELKKIALGSGESYPWYG